MMYKYKKPIASFLLVLFLQSILMPPVAKALTGGPSQPEMEGFSPVGMTDMVDLFSGDFKYNIPLMDVGGYPINLSYNAGPNMEQEASWTGLGWNLNPGVINRNMRGLPDDSYGEQVENKVYQKPNINFSLGTSFLAKALGFKVVNAVVGIGLKYNNYNGLGLDLNLNIKPVKKNTDDDNNQEKPREITLNQFMKERISSVKKTGTWIGIAKNMYPELNLPIQQGKLKRDQIRSYVEGAAAPRNFAHTSYTPNINFDYINCDLEVSLAFGMANAGIFNSYPPNGQFSSQKLSRNTYHKKAYGYLYHWDRFRENSDDVLSDINRERDGQYFKGKPFLPIPISTYDLYSVSGEGVGGQIKPYRNAIDIYSDDEHHTTSVGTNAKMEFGLGTDVHNDVQLSVSLNESKSGKWNNDLSGLIEDKTRGYNAIPYERTYYKFTGENTPVNTDLIFNAADGIISPKVQRDFMEVNSPALFKVGNSETTINTGTIPNLYSNKRTPRNQLVSYKTFEDLSMFTNPNIQCNPFHQAVPREGATEMAVVPSVELVKVEGSVYGTNVPRRLKHIGEFTVTRPDGSRYVYGVAAYNNYQKEVNFTAANLGAVSTSNGNLVFGTNKANGTDELNTRTEGAEYKRSDKFYQSTLTPAHAHSYMLSEILSPDYFDVFPVGAGPEDLGNYIRFEYGKTTDDYHWRHPYNTNEAVFSKGLHSEVYDNKASYTEGTKELWYLQSIQSKKYVAVFFIEERTDGIDADNAKKSYRLSHISLYEREKYDMTTNPDQNLEPIKSVWFEYDYSLCQEIENTNATTAGAKGKLTLKKVYFTYGFSTKRFNTYEFNYANLNPDYSSLDVDRWGNYKSSFPAGISKGEFPYVNQDKTEADQNAAAWSLTEIKLPSGGRISVNYEADDYAYVQDKRATQFMQISGLGGTSSYNNSGITYDGFNQKDYVYVKIPDAASRNGLTDREFMDECMQTNGIVLFKVYCNIVKDKYEWINGYGMVESYGFCPNNHDNVNYFYIKLKEKTIESLTEYNRTISPIVKAGLRFTKDMLPHVVNPEFADVITEDNGVQAGTLLVKLLALGDIRQKLMGPYSSMLTSGFCSQINLGKSFVRLANPYKAKLGGGCRVKSLEFTDNWYTLTDRLSNSQKIEQLYSYTNTETLQRETGPYTRTVSSGVASYEPGSGSDENPFKLPIDYSRNYNRFLPNEQLEDDGPIGESYFPSPSVGYSKVTVETKGSLTYTTGIGSMATENVFGSKKSPAKTVNEFYTARDFPVKVSYTTIKPAFVEPPYIQFLLFSFSYKRAAVSQGYCIELNDMHGKPKASYEYSSTGTAPMPADRLISYTKYYYQTDPDNPSQLNNEVKLVYDDKSVETKTLGVENEFIVDNRMKSDYRASLALQLNTTTMLTCMGLTFPAIYPDCGYSTDKFFSSVSLTLRNRNGIQHKTEVYQDGATIYSETLAYDGETGEPLVTKTTDEFKQDKYNTVIPAHWWYDGMGQGYKNIGIELNNISCDANGKIASTTVNLANYLCDGDWVLVSDGTNHFKGIIAKTGSDYYLKTEAINSNLISYTYYKNSTAVLYLKVIRSGRANMQALPVQTFASLENPLGTTGLTLNTATKIIDTKVNTYYNNTPVYRNFSEVMATKDSLYKWNDLLSATNCVIGSLSYVVNSSRTNIEKEETFAIPNSVLNGNNAYTNSAIYKQRLLNGYVNHDITIRINYFLYGQNHGISIIFIFKMGDGTQLEFESRSLLYDYTCDNIAGSTITGFSYDAFNLEGSSSMNSRLFFNNPVTGPSYIQTGPNHYVVPGNRFNSISEWVEDDHLQNTVDNHLRTGPLWHAQTTYLYKGDRSYPAGTKLGRAGYFADYLTFNPNTSYQGPGSKWKAAEITTLVDPYTGAEIESRDALNRYRTIQYNRGGAGIHGPVAADFTYELMPKLYADNARYPQVTNFDFENYNDLNSSLKYTNAIKNDRHYFVNGLADPEVKHTGKSSIKVTSAAYFSSLVCKGYGLDANVPNAILPFYPEPGKYIFTVWVKSQQTLGNYVSKIPSMNVTLTDQQGNVVGTISSFVPQGPVINGWQKIQGMYEIPATLVSGGNIMLRVTLKPGNNSVAWFDDLRIAPINSTVKTFVYNKKLQLTAQLDENNYATFYAYNEKGELIAISRETDKGIVTVKESRKLNAILP